MNEMAIDVGKLSQWLDTVLPGGPAAVDVKPVSYTHLDVYKRQFPRR